MGSQSNANGDNAVALGVGSVAEQDNTVSVGNSTTQRKITNMAAGLIQPGSTEAINGSQLHALSASVAARLGAGAGVNGDGSVNAPSYKLKSGIYNNVGEALWESTMTLCTGTKPREHLVPAISSKTLMAAQRAA